MVWGPRCENGQLNCSPDSLCRACSEAKRAFVAAAKGVSREYLLTVLMEEAAEVIQAAAKCKRFGWARNEPGYGINHEYLAKEVGDFIAIVDALRLNRLIVEKSRESKIDRVLKARRDRS
jgi:NTP pyrophosphatase (non-canonical NTP hydrolase)